jgi:hypothetical protein
MESVKEETLVVQPTPLQQPADSSSYIPLTNKTETSEKRSFLSLSKLSLVQAEQKYTHEVKKNNVILWLLLLFLLFFIVEFTILNITG